ncbi:MAG: DNA processing protein DprA [Burkholderia gladioli]|nr:MAG: DNA processing protein DprA [Burkholderia gladioli]
MVACASLAMARAAPVSPVQLDRRTLGAWLHLASAPGLTAAAGEALLRAFDSIDALFGAEHAALAAIAGEAAALDAVLDWLARSGGHVITRHDPAYPPRLATLYDTPPLLYVKGDDPARLHRRSVAIVGSRLATPQGRIDAVHFARALADAGLVVVSGLARGIDAAAHRGALGGAAGTVAVVGTGLDLVYPVAHHALAHEIVEHGALLSEWPLGTPARAANFPQRNRLIAALCDGVLVVEAAPRAGSLITARVANEMGRDVFAMPGSIHAPLSRGCRALIRDGAKLVETPADVLEEFGIAVASDAAAQPPEPASRRRAQPVAATAPDAASRPASLPPAALAVLDALGHGPAPADLLAARSGVSGVVA